MNSPVKPTVINSVIQVSTSKVFHDILVEPRAPAGTLRGADPGVYLQNGGDGTVL